MVARRSEDDHAAPTTMPLTPRVRLLWPRWRPGVLVWALSALFVLGMGTTAWLDHLLRQAGRPELVQLTAENATYAVLGLVSAAAVGALVASRRPAHPVGWLLLAFGVLTVAGVFQPARRRIQELVDRRFNRHRYDAARTIEAFSARLRQHIDLDTLTAELLTVVDQTMQPTGASLWLRAGERGITSRASGGADQEPDHSPVAGAGDDRHDVPDLVVAKDGGARIRPAAHEHDRPDGVDAAAGQ